MGIDTSMGFVAFPRGLTAWEWYDDPNTCRLFIHLLLTTGWKDKQWHGLTIRAGSRVTSRRVLAEETGLSEMQVRTALQHLESTGYITISRTAKFSVISIKNYNEITRSNQLDNQQITSKQPADNQLITTAKQINKETNITSSFPLPPSQQGEAPQAPAAPQQQPPPSLDGLETSWRELGLGRRMGPVVQQALRAYLAAGLEDALIVQAMREAAEHDVKATLPYIRSILDRCQAQGIRTLDAWQAAHRGGGAKRVDRAQPSGNDFLADAAQRPRRHKRKE